VIFKLEFSLRKRQILQEVVAKFIKKAEPVSSARIASEMDLDISPATIRKELNELEEMGYLTHPHTSAGRMPTDMGYRFYVDNITSRELNPISLAERKENFPDIRAVITKSMEIESILKKSAELLAKITSYLSMIVAPNINQSRFKHLELLKFEKDNYLMILITDTGRVYKRNFRLDGNFNDLDLQGAAGIINSKLRDTNIIDIGAVCIGEYSSDSRLVLLVKRVMSLIKDCIGENLTYNRIFVHGASMMMKQPEFIDLKNIQQFLSLIENEYLLMKILMDFTCERGFMVKIGSELFNEDADNLSLIASRYRIKENTSGTIGILGPKRMDYSRVINILELFRENLSKIFEPGTALKD